MQVTCPLCAETFDSEPGARACPHCAGSVEVRQNGHVEAATKARPNPEWPDWARQPTVTTPWEAAGTSSPSRGHAERNAAKAPASHMSLLQAAGQTLYRSMLQPEPFWSTLDAQAPVKSAFTFAWSVAALGALMGGVINVINFGAMRAQLAQAGPLTKELPESILSGAEWITTHAVGLAFGLAVATIILYPVSFLLGAGMVHLGCMLFGADKNGFRGTARVFAYAQGPVLLAWVPMFGGMLGLYVLVLEVWGIARMHNVSIGRAAAAVLVLPLLFSMILAMALVGVAVALFGN